jgi:hypothetical protein
MEEDTSTAPLLQVLVEGAAFHSRLGRVRGATLLDKLLRATLAALMAQGAEVSAAPKALMSRGVTEAVGAAEPEGVKLPVTEGVELELAGAPGELEELPVEGGVEVTVPDTVLLNVAAEDPKADTVAEPEGVLERVALLVPDTEVVRENVPVAETVLERVLLTEEVLLPVAVRLGLLLPVAERLELLEVVALGEGEAEGGPSAYTEPPESEKTTTELPPSTGELWMPSPLTPRE